MKYLFLDASDTRAFGQIGRDGTYRTFRWETRRDLVARLPGLLTEMLTADGQRLEDLDLIVAGTGPGSLTGLRVSLSFLRTLALVKPLPLLGIDLFTWARETLRLAGATGPAHLVMPAFLDHFFHQEVTIGPEPGWFSPHPGLKKLPALDALTPRYAIRWQTDHAPLLEPSPEALHAVIERSPVPASGFDQVLSVVPMYIIPAQAEMKLEGKSC